MKKQNTRALCSPLVSQPAWTLWPLPLGTTWLILSVPSGRGPGSDGEPALAGQGGEQNDQLIGPLSSRAGGAAGGSLAHFCLPAGQPGVTGQSPGRNISFRARGCRVGVGFETTPQWTLMFLIQTMGDEGQYLITRQL